uniref:Ankyrin repeat protein n=1 Tax=viral metagenome TaxID=1070528 RepID=A0A6C0E818_9ZZZZ
MNLIVTNKKDNYYENCKSHLTIKLKTGINWYEIDDREQYPDEEFRTFDVKEFFDKIINLDHYSLQEFTHFRISLRYTPKINKYYHPDFELIMSEKYYLFDIKTIRKFKIKINSNYIKWVCYQNRIDILEWWKNSGLKLEYDETALDYASSKGHVNVLEWWKHSGLPLKYSSNSIDDASRNGHINVLEWWKNSGLPLEYSDDALDSASGKRNVSVLDWWKNSGLELKYSDKALCNASAWGHIKVLNWWKNSGLELKYSDDALYEASYWDHIKVLKWWKNSGLPLKCDKYDKEHMGKNALKLWRKNKLLMHN